jgi:phosphate/sulfate permease
MVGAIFGLIFVEKTNFYKKFYWSPNDRKSATEMGEKIVISKILFWWLITIPVALGVTAGLCWILT